MIWARSCSVNRSESRWFFWKAMSQFFLIGVRTRVSVRGALPKVKGEASLHESCFRIDAAVKDGLEYAILQRDML